VNAFFINEISFNLLIILNLNFIIIAFTRFNKLH